MADSADCSRIPSLEEYAMNELTEQALNVPSMIDLESNLSIVNPEALAADDLGDELKAKAVEFVDMIMAVGERDLTKQRQLANSIDTLGDSVETAIQRHSKLLMAPAGKILKDQGDDQPLEASIDAVYVELKKIDPNSVDFTMSGFRAFLAKLSILSDPMKKWMVKYMTCGTVIEEMTKSMKNIVAEMERDNITLQDDQVAMKELAFKLEDIIRWGMFVDTQIEQKLAQSDSSIKDFIQGEILFPLRQKILSLQELQGINRQGVLVAESIIKGNKELIRGFNNGIKTTMAAIRIAAALSVSLESQRRNAKVLKGVNDLKGKMVRSTGEMLKQNTQDIIEETKTAGTRIDDLKAGWSAAIESHEMLVSFKSEFLPVLAEKVSEMDVLNKQLEKAVETFGVKMEGNEVDSSINNLIPV